ncbi:hypothetical protein SADUNF_Sadunf15G0106300 [Salix dunnii]|uniref:Uncharacterized protein n=1 Tax=Salix dunnii TaxID=1413687 RepID=A0A835JDL0_9ROSI|nr:hypothetical protein SADUNF_Sadunf15G0106300 [Salix dunnii]
MKIIQWNKKMVRKLLNKKVVERQNRADDLSREDQEALLETNPHGDLPCQCYKEMTDLKDEVARKDKEIHCLNNLLSSKDQERLKDIKTPQQSPQIRDLCSDKRPVAVKWIEARGKTVACEAIIKVDVVRKVASTLMLVFCHCYTHRHRPRLSQNVEDFHVLVTMPSTEVGTVGGGAQLAFEPALEEGC